MSARTKRYRVACLAGDGIGPELMAEASVLSEAGRLHGFAVDEVHAAFGGEAVARHGHPLPAQTREAYRGADAVLVAATREPALEGVKADLDLTWRIQRVRLADGGDLEIVSPLVHGLDPWTIERAFELARSRRAQVSAVGAGAEWARGVDAAAERHAGVIVERLPLEAVLPLLGHSPSRFDVVVTQELFAEALSEMAAFGQEGWRVVASGRLSPGGPGIFGPTHGSAPDIAGQGVANPSGMLLATSLMLGEGLGERAAARTIERAVNSTLRQGVWPADMVNAGVGHRRASSWTS